MNEKKNILFGNIIVLEEKKKVQINNVVFKEGDNFYKKKPIIKIISFKMVGQTSTIKSYTKVEKSNETRNNITGNYE